MADTQALQAALLQRYPADAYCLMWEVANSTGFSSQRRWADAVAMGLWPSRGLNLQGFELKASRTDWKKELEKPAKADLIFRYCDYWWLVAADKTIVRDGELPEPWGLMVLDAKCLLKVVKEAPKLEPQPVDRKFLAALCRAAAKPAVENNGKMLQREYERGRTSQKEQHDRDLKHANQRFDDLERVVREFEQTAGFSIRDRWDHKAKDIGRIVREVLRGDHDKDRDDLARIRKLAAEIIEHIDESKVLKTEESTEEISA